MIPEEKADKQEIRNYINLLKTNRASGGKTIREELLKAPQKSRLNRLN